RARAFGGAAGFGSPRNVAAAELCGVLVPGVGGAGAGPRAPPPPGRRPRCAPLRPVPGRFRAGGRPRPGGPPPPPPVPVALPAAPGQVLHVPGDHAVPAWPGGFAARPLVPVLLLIRLGRGLRDRVAVPPRPLCLPEPGRWTRWLRLVSGLARNRHSRLAGPHGPRACACRPGGLGRVLTPASPPFFLDPIPNPLPPPSA